ncbi:MAG: thermonuclease family protein [Candidatus Niyogibacteria bacterium]|nr:thermonuclease family protein [Candidatus Niyogibacteria bacterium]
MVKKPKIIIIMAAAVFAAAFSLHQAPAEITPPPPISHLEAEPPSNLEIRFPSGEIAQVLRAVDGDTIEVEFADGRKEKVRYIGMNAPESVDPRRAVECFGKEAAAANAALVGGREVRLVRDVSDRDKYGRLLRYVYLNDVAQTFINLELVRQGYAAAATYPPDIAHASEFRAAERAARAAGAGLWGGCSANSWH